MKTNKMDILLGIIIGMSASFIGAIAVVVTNEMLAEILIPVAFVIICYLIILILEGIHIDCENKSKNSS